MESSDAARPPGRGPGSEAIRFVAHSWWFVLLGAVVGAVMGYVSAISQPVVYQADAVVVAPGTSLSTDTFDNVARIVFQTDAVLEQVVASLRLHTTPRHLLQNKQLAIQPVSGAVAVRIVGRASDPTAARLLANAATRSFVQVGRTRGLGNLQGFETSHNGVPQPRPARHDAVVNGVAGGLLAVAVLILLFAVRRPMLDEEQAGAALRADASFRARTDSTRWARAWSGARSSANGNAVGEGDGAITVSPAGLLAAVHREAAGNGAAPQVAPYAVVLVARAGGRGRAAAVIAGALADGASVDGQHGSSSPAGLVAADDAAIASTLAEARSVIVVVARGTPGQVLSRLEEELRVAPHVERRVVVLVD